MKYAQSLRSLFIKSVLLGRFATFTPSVMRALQFAWVITEDDALVRQKYSRGPREYFFNYRGLKSRLLRVNSQLHDYANNNNSNNNSDNNYDKITNKISRRK